MKKIFKNKTKGGIPSFVLFIIIGIIVIILIIIIINAFKKTPPPPPKEEPKSQEPAYEAVIGDVKFKLKEAKDFGNILKGSESKNNQSQKDIMTTERFIEVTITAENIGKESVGIGTWNLNDLFDKEERRFIFSQETSPWIPEESRCGDLLKPGFTPTSCTKIYEVANISTGLKVKVSARSAKPSFALEEAFINIGL